MAANRPRDPEHSFPRPLLALGLLLCSCTPPASAEPRVSPPPSTPGPLSVQVPDSATLQNPHKLQTGDRRLSTPVWTHQGLWPALPADLYGLRTVEQPGHPTYDPQSRAFYASANGALVELRPDASLPVVHDGVQGADVDLRRKSGVAVSREPDLRILLHRPGSTEAPRELLSGAQFFGPRLSPNGSQMLVSESRAEGGHVWLVALDGTRKDLGPGVSPTWHPDGKRIVLARVQHDGQQITAADLWEVTPATGAARPLAQTPLPEMEPAISPDGRHLAFRHAVTGDLYVAPYPGGKP